MKLEQLQEFFPPERRRDVERLYQRYLDAQRDEEDVEGFVSHLHEQGLLSSDTMRNVLTDHEVSLSQLPDPQGLGVGTTRILSLLGKGAMGEVFLGRDPHLKRTVAVKRLDPKLLQRPAMAQRFFAEAQITAQLDHPSIVPIYGLERDREGRLSYAMKFVRGKTLTDYIREAREQLDAGKPDEDHTLKARIELLLNVLNAMDYAHKRGVIHRDLKPDNIMVGAFGEVLVMDWGIARPIGKRERVTHGDTVEKTRTGSLVGTPSFMSPEQALGNTENLDGTSDQYALGLILQELVTLRRAITAESALEVVAMAAEGMRAPVQPYNGKESIARELVAIIDKACAKDPDHRYESVDGFGDDLRRFLRDESVIADPDTGLRRLKRWVGRHRGLAIGLVFGLVALIGLSVTAVLWQSAVAMQQEREAARKRENEMQALVSAVGTQAMAMTDKLNDYEALLQGITAVGEQVMQEPAPDVPEQVVYKYYGIGMKPDIVPEYAIRSEIYHNKVSLKHADFSAPPEADLVALKPRVNQLWRMQDVLRKALLTSKGHETLKMPIEKAEKIILEEGAPLVWTYVSSHEGITAGMPGIWSYTDQDEGYAYDPRTRDWFKNTKDKRGPQWSSSGVDESGLGLLITCAQSLYDRKGDFLGVAAVDLTFNYFIDNFLEMSSLAGAGAESYIVDDKGIVVVRSGDKDIAKNAATYKPKKFEDEGVLAKTKLALTGHAQMADGRLAVWSHLAAIPWTYVVVADEAKLLSMMEKTTP